MGLVVQEKTEEGDSGRLLEMKGRETGETDEWEKSPVGESFEID